MFVNFDGNKRNSSIAVLLFHLKLCLVDGNGTRMYFFKRSINKWRYSGKGQPTTGGRINLLI